MGQPDQGERRDDGLKSALVRDRGSNRRVGLLCDRIILFNKLHHFIDALKHVGKAVHQLNF